MSLSSLKLNNSSLSLGEAKINKCFRTKISAINKKYKLRYNNSTIFNSKNEKMCKSVHKEPSAIFFQNNDINLVRSLNIDIDKDLCDNLLFKEHLMNKMGEEKYEPIDKLPTIIDITANGILESEKRLKRKKEIERNIPNYQLEIDLHKKLKEIRNKSHEIKLQKNELYNFFQNISNTINNANLDLHLLELMKKDNFFINRIELENKNYETLKNQKGIFAHGNINLINDKIPNNIFNIKKNDINNNNNNVFKENIKENFKENNNQYKMFLYLTKEEQDEEKKMRYIQILKYKSELKKLDSKINSLNEETSELRKKENLLIEQLMKHYQAVLFKGNDTRNEGLTWIIKAIWDLGKNVPMQYIPNFLDFKSIKFLFKFANKSIELDTLKKLFISQQNSLNNKRNKSIILNDINRNKNISFNKTLCNKENMRNYLLFKMNIKKKNTILRKYINKSNLNKSNVNKYIDEENESEEEEDNNHPITFRSISKIIDKKNMNYKKKDISEPDTIEVLKKRIKETEAEVDTMKKNETNRIFKEFITNDYQNKYNVTIDVILSALFGEHKKNIELNRFIRFKKDYFDSIKSLRFYGYGKPNDPG